MKRKIRDKWVAMARSGEYKQGYGKLKSVMNNGEACYCINGLLALACGYKDRTLDLVSWSGIRKRAGISTVLFDDLWRMNDGGRVPELSFPELADWIEANVPVED